MRWRARERHRPGCRRAEPGHFAAAGPDRLGSTDAGLGVPALVRVSLASGQVLSSTPRATGQDAMQDYLDNFGFTWSDGRAYAVDWEQEPSVPGIPGLFTLSVPA